MPDPADSRATEAVVAGTCAGAELPLDYAQLTRRCLGKIELVERLLASFESRFPEELSQIEQCLLEGDAPRLARLTHQLRGAAANVSAPSLQAVITGMEESARAGRLNDFEVRLADVRRAWDHFREYRSSLPGRAAPSQLELRT
jgi:HPt (histidine-containing phosphotransfer) domain-containing protein